MIIQVINLTNYKVFKKYSEKYNIYREVYSPGLMGLELRSIPSNLAKNVQRIILEGNEICYKHNSKTKTEIDLFIPGSINTFKEISSFILSNGDEDLGYRIVRVISNYQKYNLLNYQIGNKKFSFNKSYTMGILNVTPDSFSDGGHYNNTQDAINHALNMLDNDCDIIDVGGESTRPGSESVEVNVEIERVIPVIKGILEKKNDATISIDTTKSEVAKEALKAGAKIVNDISGFTFDEKIIDVVKEYNAGVVIMHIKGTPKNMQENPIYENVVQEIYDFLYYQSEKALKAGINKIIVDPGIGFGKRVEDNFELLNRIDDFKSLGFPILIGVSRKSFLGKSLNLKVDERDTATSIVESVAIKNGARIIRTHNIKNGVQVVNLLYKLN